MALSAATVGTVFPKKTFHYGTSDTILYALGIGAGADGDPADLPFLYEAQLRAFPSQATVIAWDDSWIPTLGLNEALIVHGEQRITLHRSLPAAARVSAQSRVIQVVDKGRARGALLYVETTIEEEGGDGLLATLLSTVFARGDGGYALPDARAVQPALHLSALRRSQPVARGSGIRAGGGLRTAHRPWPEYLRSRGALDHQECARQ
jgi:hypothetical protein